MKQVICGWCNKPKNGVITGICEHCGRFGKGKTKIIETENMSTDLQTKKELSPEIKALLIKENVDIAIGDMFINEGNYGRIIRIVEISKEESDRLYIQADQATDWEGTKWEHYSGMSLHDFKHGRYRKLTKSVKEHWDDALKVINGETTIEELSVEESNQDENNTSLISASSKQNLIHIQQDLLEKKKHAEMLNHFVSYEMERRKQELDAIRQKMYGVIKSFEKVIKRVMRVITTIELYLGIDEEIVQIQDGEKAPIETPITFRQRVLYFDEEIANTDDGGYDFSNVEQFDSWLIENANYKNLIAEPKGVIVFAPRRYEKDYGDFRTNSELKPINEQTYLLIRNGDCLFRIFTDKILIKPRLFPQRTELMELLKKVDDTESHFSKEDAKLKVEDLMYQYRKRAVLLQGLIDRTEILHPIPTGISIFKMDETPDAFNFVYDDDMSLPDGRLRFWDWVKKENEKIGHGSRIIMTGDYSSYGRRNSDMQHRLFKYYADEYNVPPPPHRGVYEVIRFKQTYTSRLRKGEEFDAFLKEKDNVKVIKEYQSRGAGIIVKCSYQEPKEKECLTIMHNPKDETTIGWGDRDWDKDRTRKNNIRFKIEKTDKWILNYDQISLEDIEFYLTNRADRENYLNMMPILRSMKQERLKEIENEKFFALLVKQTMVAEKIISIETDCEAKIWDAIAWWKFKNQIKRPIDKDDTKALRMIIKKLKKSK